MRTLTVEQGEEIGVASREDARPQPVSSVAANRLAEAEREFENALFGHADSDAILAAQHELMRLEEQDPAVKVRRLRTKARDLRDAYDRHMAEYGREIGRAAQIKDPTIAALVKSAANAALDEASECLTKAIAAEIEAEDIDAAGFVTLFDGVSAKLARTGADIAQRKVA